MSLLILPKNSAAAALVPILAADLVPVLNPAPGSYSTIPVPPDAVEVSYSNPAQSPSPGFITVTITGAQTGKSYVSSTFDAANAIKGAAALDPADRELQVIVSTSSSQVFAAVAVLFLIAALQTVEMAAPPLTSYGTALSSASRSTGTYRVPLLNRAGRGIEVWVSVTAGTGTVTLTILDNDPTTGEDRTVLASTALSSGSSASLRVYPAISAAANASANDVIGANPVLSAVVATAAATFAAGYSLLP